MATTTTGHARPRGPPRAAWTDPHRDAPPTRRSTRGDDSPTWFEEVRDSSWFVPFLLILLALLLVFGAYVVGQALRRAGRGRGVVRRGTARRDRCGWGRRREAAGHQPEARQGRVGRHGPPHHRRAGHGRVHVEGRRRRERCEGVLRRGQPHRRRRRHHVALRRIRHRREDHDRPRHGGCRSARWAWSPATRRPTTRATSTGSPRTTGSPACAGPIGGTQVVQQLQRLPEGPQPAAAADTAHDGGQGDDGDPRRAPRALGTPRRSARSSSDGPAEPPSAGLRSPGPS